MNLLIIPASPVRMMCLVVANPSLKLGDSVGFEVSERWRKLIENHGKILQFELRDFDHELVFSDPENLCMSVFMEGAK